LNNLAEEVFRWSVKEKETSRDATAPTTLVAKKAFAAIVCIII